MIITVTLSPAIDKTVYVESFAVNRVNRVSRAQLDPGGKGINVSKNIKAWAMDTPALGIAGGTAGAQILQMLEEQGIAYDFVQVSQNSRTNLKVVDRIAQTTTDINESAPGVTPDTLEEVFRRILRNATPEDIVVLAGRPPADCEPDLYRLWIARLKERGIPVFLDAQGEQLRRGVLAGPALIKPNQEELEEIVSRKLSGLTEVLKAARSLLGHGIGTAVVSLGSRGALFINRDLTYFGQGLTVPVASTVGAGDAMMAGMCYGIASKLPFQETCAFALAASAAAVTQSGTQAVGLRQVQTLCRQVQLEEIRDHQTTGGKDTP